MRLSHLIGLIAVILGLSSPLLAQVYKTVDEQGNTVFTDTPSGNATPVEIQQTNTAPAVKVSPKPTEIKPQAPDSIYQSLSISSPRDGHHIVNGLVAFNVNMSVEPALRQGDSLVLLINGSQHSSGQGLSRQVESIARGEHTLAAKIIDAKGKTLISSSVVNITAQRPSIIKPR